MSVSDLQTMRKYSTCSSEYYIGVKCPLRLKEASQCVLKGLVDACKAIGGQFVVDIADDGERYLQDVFNLYDQKGLILRSDQSPTQTSWRLSVLGRRRIMQVFKLHTGEGGASPAFEPRAVTVEALSDLELLMKLGADCWKCAVPSQRQKLVYVVGGEKIVYVRSGATPSVSRYYMQALLLADKHNQPVLPFRGKRYYLHIMKGLVWTNEPRRKKKPIFNFQEEGVESSHGLNCCSGFFQGEEQGIETY